METAQANSNNRLDESTPVVMQQQHQNRQQNHQVESGAEVDLHVVALKHKSAASIESRRSRSDFSLDAQARAGEIRTPEQNPGQKQNVTIEMECVVKSERIWLWARLMTLRSPVGPRLSKITNELDGGFRAINYEFSFSFMLGRNGQPYKINGVRTQSVTEPDGGVTAFVYEGDKTGSSG